MQLKVIRAALLMIMLLPSVAHAQHATTAGGPPSPDPRLRLSAGVHDAEEAAWNVRVLSRMPTTPALASTLNSDLAFRGHFAAQGNYSGFQLWDIADPAHPALVSVVVCPGAQGDVSVYGNLLFLSAEALSGRLDCGTAPVREAVSSSRLRGIRIFDIADVRHPRYVTSVQTCRGSHTHTLMPDPHDASLIYLYVSGIAPVRPEAELAGCRDLPSANDSAGARFRIEVVRVPLRHPEQAAVVSTPRVLSELAGPPRHGLAPGDRARVDEQRRKGSVVIPVEDDVVQMPATVAREKLDSVVRARGGTGAPTAADTNALIRSESVSLQREFDGPGPGPDQCHDITVYPTKGIAAAACSGYGVLLDIRDPVAPRRISAVADSNFSYWHSAVFSNDARSVIFIDEWGSGSSAKCRESDPREWGADAIYSLRGTRMVARSYYKLPVAQGQFENCTAHNGNIVPIPGRDVMVQSWFQGGVSVFDFTDAAHPVEIAFFDRGPMDSTRLVNGGSWSAYWYNGAIYSSEKVRGLDVLELLPSGWLSQNELDAAKTAKVSELNAQVQAAIEWPPSVALANAWIDQLERAEPVRAGLLAELRRELAAASRATGGRQARYAALAARVEREVGTSPGAQKARVLASTLRALAKLR